LEPEPLTQAEREIYGWQIWVPDFGEKGQKKLKQASVLISRVGGLGGTVAYQLAASGIGRLILAHAGNIKPSDLNRQLLMTHDGIGKPRIESAARRLRELNPRLVIDAVDENVGERNVERLVAAADLVVDCAPLFDERYLMNREARRQKKPLVECAVYELEGQVTTFLPGESEYIDALYPEKPKEWKREFPVFGAVASTAGSIAAIEAIKVIAGFGKPLAGELLSFDLREMRFRKLKLDAESR
jgi:molybdopterin/thiamine biosynthesis adenylyltransferase